MNKDDPPWIKLHKEVKVFGKRSCFVYCDRRLNLFVYVDLQSRGSSQNINEASSVDLRSRKRSGTQIVSKYYCSKFIYG